MSWTNSTAWGFGSDPGEDWRELALCRSYDPELFHPAGDGPALQSQIDAAKAVCRHCPVIDECFAASKGQYGIWAGLTEQERRRGLKPQPAFLLGLLNTRKTHCPQLHPYDDENTYVDKNGRRHCRVCARQRMSARRHRDAEAAWS